MWMHKIFLSQVVLTQILRQYATYSSYMWKPDTFSPHTENGPLMHFDNGFQVDNLSPAVKLLEMKIIFIFIDSGFFG